MKHRVSFYRKSEVVVGRAPRYMVDIESETKAEAIAAVCASEGKKVYGKSTTSVNAAKTIVVRSVYKSPDNPIRKKPSYVFETSTARDKWYSSHKSTQKERLCHVCKKNSVERYKRLCKSCRDERETLTEKPCTLCQKLIPVSSRRRYCDECSAKRKESQEKSHRERRSKQTTIDRIRDQIAWAKEQLQVVTLKNCKLASRFQGLRIPHIMEDENGQNKNRCRTCLQKFIDVQTVYLGNLMVEEPTDESTFLTAHLRLGDEHDRSFAGAGV